MGPPSRSTPLLEESVPALRILAYHCMPHAAVPWLVSEHVVMLFTAVPSMEEIERATESAHREANAENASTVDHEAITARNAAPVAMLRRLVDANQLPRRPSAEQRVLEQLCSLSHNAHSLNQLTSMMAPGGDFLLRPFLRQWCLLRGCDAELPETAEEQQLLNALFAKLSYVCIEGDTSFLVTPAGRDEFFLRVARRVGSRYVEGRGIHREAAVLHRCLEWTIRSHTDLNVFATAEFFDGFFLKFAWLHRNEVLLSVVAHSSTERCRALLTAAFRDAYFLGTIDRLHCETFDTNFLDPRRSAPQAVLQCMQLVTAAAVKGVRIPCTVPLADFIISLTGRALALTTNAQVLMSNVVAFEKILRASTDFAPLRTAVFRDSFFLKAADRFVSRITYNAPGAAMLIHILTLVTQDAPPAETEVFATEDVRDRLIVPFSLHLPDVPYMHYLDDAAEFRAVFTAAFDAIARTEDGSLKVVFDTEAVQLEVLPRLAAKSAATPGN